MNVRMEARMKKYRQVSPERAKVWKEKSPKYHQNRKVPVIYYLCRNRQLEHPHFMEVQLSSPDGLYLRDVIDRLNVLRGRGMASLYSWSCKRSYKSGFVWHDLCEDDLILPAHGNECVLKGSELFEESSSDKDRFSPIGHIKIRSLKPLLEPPSSRSNGGSSSSSSMDGKGTRRFQEEDLSPLRYSGSSDVSPESRAEKNSCLSLTEYKIDKQVGSVNASTQTEENVSGARTRETCTRGVSTDDGLFGHESNEVVHTQDLQEMDNSEICKDTVSPLPSTATPSSSVGKIETLESLIRADASRMNSFRILEREGIGISASTRLKATNMLMQLITCGSISVKDNNYGLIPSYKPRFSHSKFSSPYFSSSIMLGEMDCLSNNPRLMSFRVEDKEYFSGSLIETKLLKGEREGHSALKRSSSYNADRPFKQLDSVEDKAEATSAHSKCIPSIKASSSKQTKCGSARSPVSNGPRNSADRISGSATLTLPLSNGSSKRITELSSDKKQSKATDSFIEVEENVIKIDERLASGARVVIQSNPS